MNTSEQVKIKATLEWANLDRVNEMSGKYQVDLCNLSPAATKALEELGLTVHFRDDKADKGNYITCKSSNPIRAFFDDGQDVNCLVGNGTKALAVVGAYGWSFKGKKGLSPSLKRLFITDLVTFEDTNASVSVEDDDVL